MTENHIQSFEKRKIFVIDGMWFATPLDQRQFQIVKHIRNVHMTVIFILLLDNSNPVRIMDFVRLVEFLADFRLLVLVFFFVFFIGSSSIIKHYLLILYYNNES